MNQDDFLLRLWTGIIDKAPDAAARDARYETIFGWCETFDELGAPVSAWRRWPLEHRHWRTLGSTKAARATLTSVKKLLAMVDELEGLHESLLTANPHERKEAPGQDALLSLDRALELALSPDGKRVAAAEGGAITDVTSGKTVAKCMLLPNTAHVTWSPDGRLIAAATTSGRIGVFDGRNGEKLRVLACRTECAPPVFSGNALYAGDWSGHLFAWDPKSGRELAQLHLEGTMFTVLAASPAGGLHALLCHKPSPVEVLTLSPLLEETRPRLRFRDGELGDFALAPGGTRALACGLEHVTWIDLATGKRTGRTKLKDVSNVALSPDGRLAALTVRNGFRIGPAGDLSKATMLERPYASGRASFSADSRRIALATWSGGEVRDLTA